MEARRSQISWQIVAVVILLIIGIGLRFVPHIPNFAPVGAIALFGGMMFSRRLAIWLPLSILAVSDMIIGSYGSIWFTWAGFLIMALVGIYLRSSRGRLSTKALVGLPVASMLFFVVSNFGTWLTSGMYALSLSGLASCYAMGLPFFRNSLLADMSYGLILFGAYAVIRQYTVSRQSSLALAS